MIRDDVCYFVTESPEAHGVFDLPATTERMVYCAVRSVYSTEFWRAYEHGIEPQFVIVLSDPAEYQGERVVKYNGKFYRIVRTYADSPAGIELTVEEVLDNAGQSSIGAGVH